MIKFFRTSLLIIFIIIITVVIHLLSPTSLNDEKIRFVINLDDPQEKIITRLKNENFIRSPKLFTLIASLAKFPGSASWRIEPGAYLLSRRMSLIAKINTLLNQPYQKWAILVPGLRVEQIAEKLKEKFNWNQKILNEFLAESKEGYMFPDTYLLNVDYTGAEFAQKLINNFNEHFDEQMQKELLSQNVRIDTAVKIASLIERESGDGSDKALIAGIIWNRLNSEMKLQIDATAQYYTGSAGNWWPRVKPEDLRVDHAFNTYKIKGLPPTPIANPSLASLKAAVYPAETDCFFYLHDNNKKIHCAVTYEEHKENISIYLK